MQNTEVAVRKENTNWDLSANNNNKTLNKATEEHKNWTE